MQEREIQPNIFTYTSLAAWLQVFGCMGTVAQQKDTARFWMQEQIFWQAELLEKVWRDNESNWPWSVGQFSHRPGPMQIVASGKRQSCWAILWKGQERMPCGQVGEFFLVFYGLAKLVGLWWDSACFNKGILRCSTRFLVARPASYVWSILYNDEQFNKTGVQVAPQQRNSNTNLGFRCCHQMLHICLCRIAHQRLLPLCTAVGLCYCSSDAVEQGGSDFSSCDSSWTRSSEPTPGNCPLSCHRAQPRQDHLGT